jgi:hypothetical protein
VLALIAVAVFEPFGFASALETTEGAALNLPMKGLVPATELTLDEGKAIKFAENSAADAKDYSGWAV